MPVTQTDLNSFHDFATQLLAQNGLDLGLEEIVSKWRAEQERTETVESVRRGVADAEAGRLCDLSETDAIIRSDLGLPLRGR